ncbi:MAG: VanZ family protein [Gammaproteobacteria bacterium]|nr:VanZ family protein [Gammaproteobacteria bacterium]
MPRADLAARVSLHLAFWVPLAACTYLALTPSPPTAVFRVSDIILHAFAFTYLTFALGLAMRAPRLGLVGLVMLGYGAFIELAQSLEPARHAELKDLLVDAAGIAVGLAALVWAGGWCRRTAHRLAGLLLG